MTTRQESTGELRILPVGGSRGKNVTLILSVVALGFFFLVALYAPLLANRYPWVVIRQGGSASFPALRNVFAPDAQEAFVEMTFNYFAIILPLFGVIHLFLKRRRLWKCVCGVFIAIAALLPFLVTSGKNDTVDYRALKTDAETRLCIFSVSNFGPYETSGEPYEKISSCHWLGTDQTGRDVFARMVYGSRVSLAVGFFASLLTLVLGTAIGLASGYFGGLFDIAVQRIVEIVICFPTFLLLLILMTIMLDCGSRQSIILVIGVLGLTGWPGLARIVRGETLKQRQMQYVQACECSGIPTWSILFRHLLPNIAGPVLVFFAFDIAGAILAENMLSFLGFGVQIPTASWGEMMRQALDNPLLYWNLMLWPGLALFLCVLSLNFIADALRTRITP